MGFGSERRPSRGGRRGGRARGARRRRQTERERERKREKEGGEKGGKGTKRRKKDVYVYVFVSQKQKTIATCFIISLHVLLQRGKGRRKTVVHTRVLQFCVCVRHVLSGGIVDACKRHRQHEKAFCRMMMPFDIICNTLHHTVQHLLASSHDDVS